MMWMLKQFGQFVWRGMKWLVRSFLLWGYIVTLLLGAVWFLETVNPKDRRDIADLIKTAERWEYYFAVGAVVTDEAGEVIYWSDSMEELTGYTRTFAEGQNITFIMEPTKAVMHTSAMAAPNREPWASKTIGCTIMHENGDPIHVNMTVRPTKKEVLEKPAFMATFVINQGQNKELSSPFIGAPPAPERDR